MVMRLSQGQLNLLEICPRRFQHLYLDQLGGLMDAAQQERLSWGNRFHLLMQQHELGLPIAVLNEAEIPLQRCAQALVETAPALQNSLTQFRQSEHRRTLELEEYLLTAIYDLLVLEPQQAQILDWKTYPRPQQGRFLEQNWQTRLYLLVLAETTNYRPEDISMTYWFVQTSDDASTIEPQSLTFNYSTLQYQRDRRDITHLLHQLTQWRSSQQPFPQIDESQGYCPTCPFVVRCQRHEQPLDRSPASLAEIQEVPL